MRKDRGKPVCQQPDRHSPELMCGYPLPCPWHTVVLHAKRKTIEVPKGAEPMTDSARRLLKQIADALEPEQ